MTNTVTSADLDQLRQIVVLAAQHLEAAGLDAELRREAEAEIATLRAQIDSSKPKRAIVRECLLSLKSIAEQASGSALASAVLPLLPQLVTIVG